MYVNCVYCGHRYESGGNMDALNDHIRVCPDHPLSKAMDILTRLSPWASAGLDDPMVCDEVKTILGDIVNFTGITGFIPKAEAPGPKPDEDGFYYDMEGVCPRCGSKESEKGREYDNTREYDNGEVEEFECSACGATYEEFSRREYANSSVHRWVVRKWSVGSPSEWVGSPLDAGKVVYSEAEAHKFYDEDEAGDVCSRWLLLSCGPVAVTVERL